MALIPRARLRSSLKTLPGWDLSGKAIRKRYTFRDFKEAIAFVNRVADLAERAAHHPDFTIRYNQVTLSLWTHSESGITERTWPWQRRSRRSGSDQAVPGPRDFRMVSAI